MKPERNDWGIPQLKNVLDKRGTIDLETTRFAEYRVEQLRQSPGICYDDREAYVRFKEGK